jgi:ribosome-associated protein
VILDKVRPEVLWAIEAAQDKKAQHITVLDLNELSAFAQYFVVCSGESTPQLEAISDAIEERLDSHGVKLAHREGRTGAEWVLLDYGRVVVHIFSERARLYYDLERLWRSAPRTDVPAPNENASRSSNIPPRNSSDSEATQP